MMNTPTTLVQEVQDFFPTDYGQALHRFTVAAASLKLPLEMNSHPLDDRLSTESVWIGPASAPSVLVIISGTHGVEGPVGTAAQLDLLAELARQAQLPPDTALLLIFALNPFGYAMSRRCDSDGIDLNRNFIDFSETPPPNPGYTALMEAIYTTAPDRRNALFNAYRKANGERAFEMAISGGQYTDPDGPFYGGKAPAHGNRVIGALIGRHQLEGRHLAVVDIHSGLGPYGHGELVCDHPLESKGYATACRWFGPSVASPATGESSSVPKAGLLDYRWHALMQERGCFVTLEFGTYSLQALFDTVLNDHAVRKEGDPETIRQSAAAMREHFCPADGYWRELVLLKSRQVIRQALTGLTS